MLTPVDIENKEFTKAFRGYDIYEVEEFMKSLVADYEKLYRENGDLKERNAVLNEAIASYKGMEETMQNAILVAQRTAEDIKQNAYDRSETILKDAERRAAEAVNNANRSIGHLEKTYLNMQREMNGFKAKMSALLSTYMQLLSELPEQGTLQAQTISLPVEEEPVRTRSVETPAPTPEPMPEPAGDMGDTNTFTLPLTKKPVKKEAPSVPEAEDVTYAPERKLNPVVEELLKKKREEQKQVEQKSKEDTPVQKPAEFSVIKETIQTEPTSIVSEINVEDLEDFDVFKDDTL